MVRSFIAGMVVLGMMSAAAQAATLQGDAMVNRGEGYKAQAGGALKAGETVMVRQGTTATIAFDDGCAFTLSAGRVFTVGAKSPCADGMQSARTIDFSGRMGQAGDGGGGPPGVNPLVIGGVVLGVGGGLLIYNATKNDSSSSSSTSSPSSP